MSKYPGFRIKDIHAIIAIGDDDEEGIPAFFMPGNQMPMPLIASDRVRLDIIKELAQQMADGTGQNFEVVKFTVREKIGEIKSKRKPS